MKRTKYVATILAGLLSPLIALAVVTIIPNGGTGTSTRPLVNQVLVGDGTGAYAFGTLSSGSIDWISGLVESVPILTPSSTVWSLYASTTAPAVSGAGFGMFVNRFATANGFEYNTQFRQGYLFQDTVISGLLGGGDLLAGVYGYATTTDIGSTIPTSTVGVYGEGLTAGVVGESNGDGAGVVALNPSGVALNAIGNTNLAGMLLVTDDVFLASTDLGIGGVNYVFPGSQGGASTVLTNDGSGNLSWGVGGSGSNWTFDNVGGIDVLTPSSSISLYGTTTAPDDGTGFGMFITRNHQNRAELITSEFRAGYLFQDPIFAPFGLDTIAGVYGMATSSTDGGTATSTIGVYGSGGFAGVYGISTNDTGIGVIAANVNPDGTANYGAQGLTVIGRLSQDGPILMSTNSYINSQGTATSSFSGGIDLAAGTGCFAIAGECIGDGGSTLEADWTNAFAGDETAITPTSSTKGIFVTASSTIAANFRVDGNTTLTGLLISPDNRLGVINSTSSLVDTATIGTLTNTTEVRTPLLHATTTDFDTLVVSGAGTVSGLFTAPDSRLAVINSTSSLIDTATIGTLTNSTFFSSPDARLTVLNATTTNEDTANIVTLNVTTESRNTLLHATTTDFDALQVNGNGVITGNATTSGYLVVGTTNPVNNMAAGDLLIGGSATTTGNLRVSTWGMIGTPGVEPVNVTAGDFTAVRFSVGNSALGLLGNVFRVTGSQTNTANGATNFSNIAANIVPTSNSLADYRAINILNTLGGTAGSTYDNIISGNFEGARFAANGTGQVTSVRGINSTGVVLDNTSPTTVLVTTVKGAEIDGLVRESGTSKLTVSTILGVDITGILSGVATTTDLIGLRVNDNPTGSKITNVYGIDIAAQTQASTTATGIRIAAPSGATNNYALNLSDTGGTLAGGITWGTGSSNLYRSAANALTTDGSLTVAGLFNAPDSRTAVLNATSSLLDTATIGTLTNSTFFSSPDARLTVLNATSSLIDTLTVGNATSTGSVYAGTFGLNSQYITSWSDLSAYVPAASNLLYASSSALAVTSSAEQTICTKSIAGGTLGTAGAIRMNGVFSFEIGTVDTFTLKIKYGATTLFTGTFSPVGAATVDSAINYLLYADGATNAQRGSVATDTGGNSFASGLSGQGTAAEDSTAAKTMSATIQSTNGTTFRFLSCDVEKI